MAETSFLWRDTAMRIRERFNPRAPCGARREVEEDKKLVERFQPTRPLRGATRPDSSATECQNNFNPRAPCGARLGDLTADLARAVEHFNPRAPCGARRASFSRQLRACPFQPTRPLRGATLKELELKRRKKFQPTRPLRGATPDNPKLEEQYHKFQPTRPLRGATGA